MSRQVGVALCLFIDGAVQSVLHCTIWKRSEVAVQAAINLDLRLQYPQGKRARRMRLFRTTLFLCLVTPSMYNSHDLAYFRQEKLPLFASPRQ